MSKQSTENSPKIYLKDSDKVRLASRRIRIVRETHPREPCDNEDLVFEKADGKVPSNTIYTWHLAPMGLTFFTTAERCKEMVSEDPRDWTKEKLKKFAEIEERLYRDWFDGHVYGYILEQWDDASRSWKTVSSLYGMYGAKDLLDNIAAETDGISTPICVEEEEMKYELDNVEMTANQFT